MSRSGKPDEDPVESVLFSQGAWPARSFLRDAPIGIAIKSGEGRYLWANASAERLMGHPSGALQGRTDRVLFKPVLSQQLERADELALTQRRPVSDEVELGASGPVTVCQMHTFPLSGADGELLGLGVLVTDRSAERREIAALREGLRKLEQENRDLRVMLDELGYLATTDKLTTAWNRRRLDEAIGDEMNRLERYGHPVSVLFLDIDYFKQINDRYGHVVGDRVLTALSTLLRNSFRRSDSLTRWGGEEFIVLCPNTTLSMATLLAERLRKSVAVAAFVPVDRVTVSIGVAECVVGESWEQWFQRADRALLRAKQDGRNRVWAAPETMSLEWAVSPAAGRFLQLTWRSAYRSGHPLIDDQHRMLFEQSNRLLAAVLDNLPEAQIEAAFEDLIQGVGEHFRDEEGILRRSGYAGTDEHATVHRELYQSACALLDKFRSGSLGMGELFEFLARDVIAGHLLGADRHYFGELALPGGSEPLGG